MTGNASSTLTAIIGAGIAGLIAARELTARGVEVVVFDKGRGPGGRTSHRKQAGVAFDHGAQYFTARDPSFRVQVDAWRATGVVSVWRPRILTFGPPSRSAAETTERFVGVPGMNAMAVDLARGLDVRSSVHVRAIEDRADGLHLFDTDGRPLGRFAQVIVTTPAPQAATLVSGLSPALADRAVSVRMLPCWTVMLAFDEPLECPFDAAFVRTDSPLSWVARNNSKPGRGPNETWTLHATTEWTVQAFEQDASTVTDALIHAFSDLIERPVSIAFATAHRWRYAFVERPADIPCMVDHRLPLVLAGDWCLGPRIEAAYLSGRAAADALLRMKR